MNEKYLELMQSTLDEVKASKDDYKTIKLGIALNQLTEAYASYIESTH